MNEDDVALIAEAELGEDARAFVQSELGQTIIGLARQDSMDALRELAKVDPTDAAKVAELQRKAAFGERFEQYLAELVQRGNNALALFQQERQQS